jgi:hypothetical protein
MDGLLELLEGCTELRVCCDPVELAKKVESTTGNRGGLGDVDEWCRHVYRTRFAEVEDCLGKMRDMTRVLYSLRWRCVPAVCGLSRGHEEGVGHWIVKTDRHETFVRSSSV